MTTGVVRHERTGRGRSGWLLGPAFVVPGGRLLFVHHEMDEVPHAAAAQDYVMPQHMVDHLGAAGWKIERDEIRERHVSGGAGHGRTRDRVVPPRRP